MVSSVSSLPKVNHLGGTTCGDLFDVLRREPCATAQSVDKLATTYASYAPSNRCDLPVVIYYKLYRNETIWRESAYSETIIYSAAFNSWSTAVIPGKHALIEANFCSPSQIATDGTAYNVFNRSSVPKYTYGSATFVNSRTASAWLKWLVNNMLTHDIFLDGKKLVIFQGPDARYVVSGMCNTQIQALEDIAHVNFQNLISYKIDFARTTTYSVAKAGTASGSPDIDTSSTSVLPPKGWVDSISTYIDQRTPFQYANMPTVGMTCQHQLQTIVQQGCISAPLSSLASSYVRLNDFPATFKPLPVPSLIHPQRLSCGLPVSLSIQVPYTLEVKAFFELVGTYAFSIVPARHALVTSSVISVSSLNSRGLPLGRNERPREVYVNMMFVSSAAAAKWIEFFLLNVPSHMMTILKGISTNMIVQGMCESDVAMMKKKLQQIVGSHASFIHFVLTGPESIVQPTRNFWIGSADISEVDALRNMQSRMRNMSDPSAQGIIFIPNMWTPL